MEARRLLLIDDDPKFKELVSSHLLPYGFEVVVADDTGNPLGQVKVVKPELIMIAVELPDKHGYALCNKAKKGVAKRIPVILTTASLSPSGFLKHKKLKNHADEYLDKRTLSSEEFMEKVDQLVGLGELVAITPTEAIAVETVVAPEQVSGSSPPPPPGADVDIEVDLDDNDDIEVIEEDNIEDLIVEDDLIVLEATEQREEFAVDATTVAPNEIASLALLDGLEDEADAALNALEMVSDEDSAQSAVVAKETSSKDKKDNAPNKGNNDDVILIDDLDFDEPEIEEIELEEDDADPQPAIETVTSSDLDLDLDLGLAEVESAAREDQSGIYSPQALAKIRDLKRETERLRDALADIQTEQPVESVSQSRQREFLNLRERISARDKEIDKITARAELAEAKLATLADDLSDANRAVEMLEGAKSSTEARLSELESLANSHQVVVADFEASIVVLKAEATKLSKERDEEREASSEMTIALSRIRAELEEHEQAVSLAKANTDAQRDEHNALVERLEEKILDLDARHAEAIEKVKAVHAEELAAAAAKLEHIKLSSDEAISHAIEEKREVLNEWDQKHTQTIAALTSDHDEQLQILREGKENEFAEQLRTVQVEHADVLANAQKELTQATQEVETLRGELDASVLRYQTELSQAKDHTQQTTQQLEQAHVVALDAFRAELKSEKQEALEALRVVHQATLAEAQSTFEGTLEAQQAEYKETIEDLKNQGARALEAADAERVNALTQAAEQHAADIEALNREHAEALVASESRVAETEESNRREKEQALADLRAELEASHQTDLEQLVAEHRRMIEAATRASEQALTELEASHQRSQEEEQRSHQQVLDDVLTDKAAALAELNAQMTAALEQANVEQTRALNAASAEKDALVLDLKEQKDLQVQALADQYEGRLSRLEREGQEALAIAKGSYETTLAEATEVQRQAIENLNRRYESELDQLRSDHSETTKKDHHTHTAELEKERTVHAAVLAEAARERDELIAAARAQLESELAAAAQAKANAVAALEQQRLAELAEAAEARTVAENQIIESFETTKTQIEHDHAEALSAQAQENERLEEALKSSRANQITLEANFAAAKDSYSQITAEFEEKIGVQTAIISERDKQLIGLRSEVDELEEENAQFQEQVLKAYQKIKSDESTVARAKKAMAIALTLLDEES